MYRSLRLALLVFKHLSAAIFLWPLSAFVLSSKVWEAESRNHHHLDWLGYESTQRSAEQDLCE